MVSFYASWAHLSEETQEFFVSPNYGAQEGAGNDVVSLSKEWHVMQAPQERALEKDMVPSHVAPLNRGEQKNSGWKSAPWFRGPSLFCLVWSHPDIISSGFVPSSCRVMSISISCNNIPSLTSPIQLGFIWFHLTPPVIFLPFPKEKPKQGSSGDYIGRKRWSKKGTKALA